MAIDLSKVGQQAPVKTPEEAYDNAMGTYADPVDGLSVDRRLPLKQMPQGPDPDPFKLGGGASGG